MIAPFFFVLQLGRIGAKFVNFSSFAKTMNSNRFALLLLVMHLLDVESLPCIALYPRRALWESHSTRNVLASLKSFCNRLEWRDSHTSLTPRRWLSSMQMGFVAAACSRVLLHHAPLLEPESAHMRPFVLLGLLVNLASSKDSNASHLLITKMR